MPLEEKAPRRLPERTGRHFCAACLREITAGEYFGGDFYCEKCAANDSAFPLASTPEAKPEEPK
jgi:hypothetical protein